MRLMKRYLLFILLGLVLLLPPGCGTLHEDYVQSSQETYKALAPAVEKWLSKEPGFVCEDEAAVEDYNRLLRSWKAKDEEALRLIEEQKKED